MYSFAQRSDTDVVDEPFYGHYLNVTHAPQPHRDELIGILETDPEKILDEVIRGRRKVERNLFLKNMAHHMREMNLDWMEDPSVRTVFLIRDPRQMLPSLVNQIEEPNMRDAAYQAQFDWYDRLAAQGTEPIVIDSRLLLLDPRNVLEQLCTKLGIDFQPAMLSWEPGPRPEDGPWAPYWYHNLHRSTGFVPFREKKDPLPESLRPLWEECVPLYDKLLAYAIRPDPIYG